MPSNPGLIQTLQKRWRSTQQVISEFPSQFWIVVAAAFIDRLGAAMLFPFFTLYLTRKFDLGMTQVGGIFAVFAITGVVGSMVGGALTDRLGRKGMVMFGLVMSASTSILMGVVDQIQWFFLVVVVVGVLADAGGPAQQALVADLLPEEQRAQGFGILRVVFNLAVTIGPLIGGLLASQSYLFLFIADALTSLVTAIIFYFALHETWKPHEKGQAPESLLQTFGGYRAALKDTAFVWFMVASALMVLVYMQMNTTLAVFLRDNHGVAERGFSYILSLNAVMVVLFQFPITRWATRYRPLTIMAAGTLFYAFGFAMYGFVSAFLFFLVAMAVITVGEMLVSPVGQAIVTRLAPEEMRGRYMAVYGFSWVIPVAVGPLMAGLVLDNLNPDLLWYAAGVIGVIAAAAYFLLENLVDRARWRAIYHRLQIVEQLEEGQISAATAAQMLEGVERGPWERLAPEDATFPQPHMRIRVSDQHSGLTKVDLSLPLGLVNTVLHLGGTFSTDLDPYDTQSLKELISQTADQGGPHQAEAGEDRLEVTID